MELTQEYLRDVLDYQPETGVFTWKISPNKRIRVGDATGTSLSSGYRRVRVLGTSYRAHRLAWFYVHGEWPPEQIDHINGVRDDNRIKNLRCATYTENQKNKRRGKNNTSGVVGVSWNKQRQKWHVVIKVNRQDIFLGLYEDWFESVCARKSAENKYGFHPNHGRC